MGSVSVKVDMVEEVFVCLSVCISENVESLLNSWTNFNAIFRGWLLGRG